MNRMDLVCRMLGLELFEKFNITPKHWHSRFAKIKNPYYFTDEGLINKYSVLDNFFLADLIIGCVDIEKVTSNNKDR